MSLLSGTNKKVTQITRLWTHENSDEITETKLLTDLQKIQNFNWVLIFLEEGSV